MTQTNSQIPEKLLAKSIRNGKEITLIQHLSETEQSAGLIFRLDGRWGHSWCRFFKIGGGENQKKFLLNLRIAALFHDLGKANIDFYRAVNKKGFYPQLLRHEHLSALFLHIPEVRQWLSANPSLDLEVITGAVLSHHLKASGEEGDWRWGKPQTTGKTIQLYLQHAEVKETLQKIATIAGLGEYPDLQVSTWANNSYWQEIYSLGVKAAREFERKLRKDRDRLSLLLAVKAGLIVSDAVASGLVREGHSIEEWIEEVVHADALKSTDIASAVIEPRIRQIKEKRGTFTYDPFQTETAKQGSRALLLAACGAGKTLAAWKWAERIAETHSIGRVIFLYPTRGTATEGFRDYVGWAPEAEGTLLTGTATYELEQMEANPNDAVRGKKFVPDESQVRLFALGFWSKRYFSATVDQFLGFIEHSYTGLCLLPALADSAVIIDEVHSFSRGMFDSLVSFLEHFDVPVLCMTATLPPSRKKELVEKLGLKAYPTDTDFEKLETLKIKEEHPRYRIHRVENSDQAMQKAIEAYQQRNERVLWVVNTVDRCRQVAQQLKERLKVDVLVYHSRFKLEDRKNRHADVVNAFQQTEKPAIAVTTQVCEMSLDLDADVLVTEIAPIPALVQRAGRSNRHLVRGMEFQASIYYYRPEKTKPYTKADLDRSENFLQALGSKGVSQMQMAKMLEEYAKDEEDADGSSRFVSSGYFATSGALRDEDDFTVPCLLDSDLTRSEARSPKQRVALILSVPKNLVDDSLKAPHWLPPYLKLANHKHYSALEGFGVDVGSHHE
jgi:CRISPR-associated endonuclease/helicase Cas3